MKFRDASFPYFEVNAFTDRPFGGNPAGVAFLSGWPDDGLLREIAHGNMLSETAYLVAKGEDRYHLRWFTPTVEVDLCGHATLASGFIVLNIMRPDLSRVRFDTQSGEVSVSRFGHGLLAMDFPVRAPKQVEATDQLRACFDQTPQWIGEANWNYLFVFEGGEKALAELKPDFAAMRKFPENGFIATAKGENADFVSRYFAPNHGILEDPVTGSAHCTLAPYWAKRLGKEEMSARQISQRGGDLGLKLEGGRLRITGHCFLVKEGVYHLVKKF